MSIAIAIDGPAGAGKSTIARLAAKELGYIYVDTGALYRAIGLAASRRGYTAENKTEIIALLDSIKVELAFNDRQEQIVLLDGEDVSGFIRTPEISMMASAVSAIPEVRAFLLDLQRNMAHTNNVIMDGRDIGTVVLPDAKIKIFLSASPECRARRRYDELIEKGMDVKYEDILNDVIARDYADSHREIAPLKPADEAIIVDTSGEDLETSVNKLMTIMRENI
ncbi:MAG: (d)CMP kinase [Ruminococcus sp.]|nr:(d)CMP kinase [Ruminococcus sp.]